MSKIVTPAPEPGRGRALAELRRSGAAGIHRRRTPRGERRRRAIRESREG